MNSSSYTFIKTKLFPPVSRSPLVYRSRLLDVLAANKLKKLTLVAAPAGFGKTTILGQWFDKCGKAGEYCCWCSLDREDNDPARFLRHIINALRTVSDIGPDVLRQLDTILITDITDMLPALIYDLGSIEKDIRLFIDDYHYAVTDEIHHFIELLINLSPDNLRLVIAGRIRPPLSLSSLRVKNELCEITANQLRFDNNETMDFMRNTIGLELSSKQLDRLYEHSEGWAAGLQLVSLSLHDPARRDRFIATFSGSLRDIADYLTSDVLNQQEPDVRDFLLRTAILDRLCADACNAVTNNDNAHRLLEKIETGNLFLVPLDETRKWYRYHHLFQEFLLTELRRTCPDEIVSLYKRASDWFASSGQINEAVNYALLSGDTRKVGQLVQTGTMETMSMEGRMTALLSWVSGIPYGIRAKFPRILIQECIALSHLCRPAVAADVAAQAQTAIHELPGVNDYQYTDSELKQIHEEEAVLPFLVAFCKDDIEGMEPLALNAMNTTDDLILGMTNNFLGYTYLQKHQLAKAHKFLNKARFHHLTMGTYYGAVFSDCFITMAFLLQYQLQDAYEHAHAAEQLAEKIQGGHIPGTAKAKVMQAVVLYEWNRIDEAMEILNDHLHKIEYAGQISIAQIGYIILARCYAAKWQYQKSIKALERCLTVSQHTNREYINLSVETEKSRLAVLYNYDNHGKENIEDEKIGEQIHLLHTKWNRESVARLFLQIQNKVYADNSTLMQKNLNTFIELCEERELTQFKLRLLLLSVINNIKLGQDKPAYKQMESVIDIACMQNGFRSILDMGNVIKPVLIALRQKYLTEGDSLRGEFITTLLIAMKERQEIDELDTGNAPLNRDVHLPALIEHLSHREIEILELMAKGNSNAKISSCLLISENTVKWHIKNVFAKLGVNNRTAAVIAAQQHQLLQ